MVIGDMGLSIILMYEVFYDRYPSLPSTSGKSNRKKTLDHGGISSAGKMYDRILQ
jgi:hypothetical protein